MYSRTARALTAILPRGDAGYTITVSDHCVFSGKTARCPLREGEEEGRCLVGGPGSPFQKAWAGIRPEGRFHFPTGNLNCEPGSGGCPEPQDKALGGQASSAGQALRPLAPRRAGLEGCPGAWGCGGAGERAPWPRKRGFHSLLRVASPRPAPPALSPGRGGGGAPGTGPPFPGPAPSGKNPR